MTKSQAIAAFGSAAGLARAVGVSRSYVSQWPEELEQGIADRVRGAAVRLGVSIPGAGAPRREAAQAGG